MLSKVGLTNARSPCVDIGDVDAGLVFDGVSGTIIDPTSVGFVAALVVVVDGLSKRGRLEGLSVRFGGDGGKSTFIGGSIFGSATGTSPSRFSPPWKCPLQTLSC